MLVHSVHGNIFDPSYQRGGKLIVDVAFDWFELGKRRVKKVAEDGTELGIALDKDFADGDILAETDDKIYVVTVRSSQLISIQVKSMKEMGRLCFELGNRHLSIKVEEGSVTVPYDHPTFEYTQKLGFTPNVVEGDFSGFLIVKAHSGTGTLVPGTGKTTGDLAEEADEAVMSSPKHPEQHSHDNGRTWHSHQ